MEFVQATTVLVGAMVGVGIFGIPFAFAKAGFWLGMAWLVIVACITGAFTWAYSQLIDATPGLHQITGYATMWLGAWGRRVATLAQLVGSYGALLAYMIVAGGFLHNVLSQVITIPPVWYSLGFVAFWSVAIVGSVRNIATFEVVLVALYSTIIVSLLGVGMPHVSWTQLTSVTWEFWHLPYGVLMFAFSGIAAVPVQYSILSARPQLVNRSITTAIVIVSVLYTFFALTVVGISGDITSPDAFTGLYDVLGPTVVMIGSLLGILTTSTSFVMLGAALFETFTLDYRVPRLAAWGLTIVPPVGLFLSGLRNAIDVIGLAGGVAIGVQCVVILLAYLAMLRATISLQVRSRLLAYILVGILVVAGITQYWTP
jgi:amino acid permease